MVSSPLSMRLGREIGTWFIDLAASLRHRQFVVSAWQAFIGVFAVIFITWLVVRPNGESGLVWFSDVALTVTALLAGVIAFVAALRMKGRDRVSWMLIAAGTISWGLGMVAWTYYELILGQETPFPSLADLGYLGMIPLMFAGLVSFPSGQTQGGERIKIGLDALLIMASIATVSWFAVLGPLYSQADATPAEKYIGLAYPAGDVILIFALVGGVARGWISRRSSVPLLLMAGILAFIVADSGFTFLTLHNAYASGNPIDIGWPLGFMLVATAALRRWSDGPDFMDAGREAGEYNSPSSLVRQLVPYALVIGVTVLLFYSRFQERGLTQNTFVALALLTVFLILVRQFVTLRDNERLSRENRRRYEEAQALADRDPVTGLFNHRYFHNGLETLLIAADKTGSPVGLALIDIDDFKLFNDTYGHPQGDAVLKLVASYLAEESSDGRMLAARYGGDEFTVAVPGANEASMTRFIERLHKWTDGVAIEVDETSDRIPIHLSCGYAVFPEQGSRPYEVISAADASLYEAKRSTFRVSGVVPGQRDTPHPPGTFPLLESLVTSVNNKDQYTKAHCDMVSEYAVLLAQALGLSPDVQKALAVAGALHDVGKICIPDRVLRKPGPLSDEEYAIVKLHVGLASNLIQDVPRRKDVLDAVLNHHERFDGSGYPRGLRGQEIPLLGRVIAVADAFSAMTIDRPYRRALEFEQAIEELQANVGTQFDPELVGVFVPELGRRAQKPRRATVESEGVSDEHTRTDS